MSKIIRFPKEESRVFRTKFEFINKAVHFNNDDAEINSYPCIVLYEKETGLPVYYTGLERYLCALSKSAYLKNSTLTMKATAVCHFLNYLLYETELDSLHECRVDEIRRFLIYLQKKKTGESYKTDTWNKYRNFLTDFLVLYYINNKDHLDFNYSADELMTKYIISEEKKRKRIVIEQKAVFSVKAPKNTHKKNRILANGYLELLLYEAKKYEPGLVLGIALGAYAGLREGEVVNVSVGRFRIIRRSFGMISGVEIDLNDTALHFQKKATKTDVGSIKINRSQKVYDDFVNEICDLYDAHIEWMIAKGYDTSPDAPLFVNKQGNPMSVKTYSTRIKELFYDRFLPALRTTCEKQGTYADNAAFIEIYEKEYPGAHMFRHWFTMYLLTQAKLTSAEIMTWRGDSSQESMNSYIHENADLIEVYRNSTYTFQSNLLEDIY